MTTDSATLVRPPIARLSVFLLGACVLGACLGAVVGWERGSGALSGFLSLASTLPGVILSLMLLNIRPAQPAGMWAVPVIAGTMVRAFLTLLIAIGMVLSIEPDRAVLMLTILGVLLACLAIEVGVVLSMVNACDEAEPASLEGVRS